MTDKQNDDWMDTPEAATYAKKSEYTLRDWANRGIIPAYRPGGKMLMFKRSDIDAAIRSWAIASKAPGKENG